jgi:hypothetical protein
METQIKERQAGYYKIINAEKQYQDGVATCMYWITDASRVLVLFLLIQSICLH